MPAAARALKTGNTSGNARGSLFVKCRDSAELHASGSDRTVTPRFRKAFASNVEPHRELCSTSPFTAARIPSAVPPPPPSTSVQLGWVLNYKDFVDPHQRNAVMAKLATLFSLGDDAASVAKMLAALGTYSKDGVTALRSPANDAGGDGGDVGGCSGGSVDGVARDMAARTTAGCSNNAAVPGGGNDSAEKQRCADAVPGLRAALDEWCSGPYAQLERHPRRIQFLP